MKYWNPKYWWQCTYCKRHNDTRTDTHVCRYCKTEKEHIACSSA